MFFALTICFLIQFWKCESRINKQTKNKIIEYRTSVDEVIRTLSYSLSKKGVNVVGKYNNSSNENYDIFKPGKNEVLNIIYSYLPTLDTSDLNVDELIDFLKDEETQI